jgi:hypothetical protein
MMIRQALRKFSYNLTGAVQGQTYIPEKVVEFDPKGDTLIYSNEHLAGASVFFPMPYSIGTWSIPAMGYAWYADVLGLGLGSSIWLPIMYGAILPHCWHLYNLRFRVDKVWFVRGGFWKLQTSGVNNVVSYAYTDSANLSILSGSIDEDG